MGPPCSTVLGGGNECSQDALKRRSRRDGGIAMEAKAKVLFHGLPKKTPIVDQGF